MEEAAPAADPVRLNPANPHYFKSHGKAVALVTSGEHYGSVINSAFDSHRYLATLAAGGFQLRPGAVESGVLRALSRFPGGGFPSHCVSAGSIGRRYGSLPAAAGPVCVE
ncbi:MAG TPA: hypothetical protein VML19_10645 [Verrucomicrobiae bacterium]|nr:hypothetical protein [Verrucomicrobiae bacterium]